METNMNSPSALTKVEELQSKIDNCKRQIAQLKSEINAKNAWAHSQPWYNKPASLLQAMYFSYQKSKDIVVLNQKIVVLEAAKLIS